MSCKNLDECQFAMDAESQVSHGNFAVMFNPTLSTKNVVNA